MNAGGVENGPRDVSMMGRPFEPTNAAMDSFFFLLKFRKISIDEDVECDWVVESFMA